MVLRICGDSLGDCQESTATSFYGHRPSIVASCVFMAVAGLCLIANTGVAIKARSSIGFVVVFTLACAVSVFGWAGRIAGANDPWGLWPWMMSSAALSIAPLFLSSAIYLVLGKIVNILGAEHSLVSPRVFTAALVSADIIAFALQCAGFGIAFADVHHNTLNVNAETRGGARIVMAASGLQLLALLTALALLLVVGARAAGSRRVYGYTTFHRDHGYVALSKGFLASASAVVTAIALLAGRLGYRVALLSGGIRGTLARNQNLFIVLDGLLVAVALVMLTLLHPALFLRAGPGSSIAVKGREGKFEKLRDAEDAAFTTEHESNLEAVSEVYMDQERRMSAVPLEPLVFEPPKSYDPQTRDDGRYEPTRSESSPNRRSLTPQPYETGVESRDASRNGSRETSPKPYGSGGI